MTDASPPVDKKLEAEANERFADAQNTRALRDQDFREAYFFCAPHRLRPGTTTTTLSSNNPPQDAEELQTSIGYELALDFATVALNTFVPQTEDWCELAAGPDEPEDQKTQIEKLCQDNTAKIFKAIKASHFYTEFAKTAFPDAAIGNVAMWVSEDGMNKPLACLAASLREVFVTLGPKGEIDDRFVRRNTRYRYLPALVPGVTFSKAIQGKIDKKGREPCEIKWGFWRKWSEQDECWQHIILVDDTLVHSSELKGEGCCPLVIGRFNATSDSPWGYGPLMMSLADLRMSDVLAGLKIEGVDFSTRPPSSFPSDSMSALENGVEPGMFYPVRPGDEGAIKPLFTPGKLDSVLYETTMVEERLRKIHFSESPTQRGKTPPTATQWAGEITIAQRRIGTPGLSFFDEFCIGIFKRFKYLLEKRGTIQPVQIDGRAIAVYPSNPAQRAADMLKVQNALQLIQIGSQAFPEEWKVRVDGGATLQKLKDMLNDTLVTFRDPKEIQTAIDQIKPLIGGAAPGAPPPAPGMPPQ